MTMTGFRPTVEQMNAYAPQHSRIFKEVRLRIHSFIAF